MKKALLILVIFSICFGCKKDNPTSPVKTPQISSISPTSAFIGDYISINGTNFGETQGTSFVLFNNLKANDFLSWSETLIKVAVPTGATTGKVSVTFNGQESNKVDFAIKPTDPGDFELVTIGSQVWMLKNLNVDHYRNGDPVPEVKNSTEWVNLKTGAWCYYNNDPARGAIYGKLYNWYAVNDPRGLAPAGWHVASDSEWTALTTYLGGENVAGGKLKEKGTSHWLSSFNGGATNESGFSALPGGYRGYYGSFYGIGSSGYWWSSTEDDTSLAWGRTLYYLYAFVGRDGDYKEYGFSVRCIKGN